MNRILKDGLILGLSLFLMVFLFWSQSSSMSEKSPKMPEQTSKAADFTLNDIDGNQFTLSKLKGNVVFLNFFATWCPPCRSEMPSIQELHKIMSGEKFMVVAVSVDKGGKDVVAPYIKDHGYAFKTLLDPDGSASAKYSVSSIPATFIIDKDGKIVRKVIGSRDWSDPKFIEIIRLLLKK